MKRFKRFTMTSLQGRQNDVGVTLAVTQRNVGVRLVTPKTKRTRLNHPLPPPTWRGIIPCYEQVGCQGKIGCFGYNEPNRPSKIPLQVGGDKGVVETCSYNRVEAEPSSKIPLQVGGDKGVVETCSYNRVEPNQHQNIRIYPFNPCYSCAMENVK